VDDNLPCAELEILGGMKNIMPGETKKIYMFDS
jgi:hypothetical protein